MKLFLTGGTGFVGHHIAARFIEAGWDVTALVRESSKSDELKSLGATLVTGDLLNADTYQDGLEKSDLAINCAGLIKAVSYDQFRRVNADGAAEVARAAERSGVPRYVLISSIAAAGPTDGAGNELAGPVSSYGSSKREGERKVLEKAKGMEVVIIRPPIIYGPRDRGFFSAFKMAHKGWFPMYGNGTYQFSIVHVEDLVRAIHDLAVKQGKLPAAPLYPEDGAHPTWRVMSDIMEVAVGKDLKRPKIPGALFHTIGGLASFFAMLTRQPALMSLDKVKEMAQPHWKFSHKDLTRASGWVPRIRLNTGIAETYRWYVNSGWL